MGEGKAVANNKKAYHDYFIEETYEAGIVLTGTEVKSIRMGRINLKDSYAEVNNGEIFIYNMHISPYEKGNIFNVDPVRKRKLLMHKKEISKLLGYITQQGYTLIPTKVYINQRGLVKLQLAVAKGKKLYDKRDDIAKKEANRRIQQELRERQKSY
ncbi:SsrA-binding protein [Anaerosolibacter carboniphilus]|uniref:SsrA-binding protein n=1 Tax=Anaerosolibacter carboniphilus TaxID=1417629 RepID=A0A841KQY9_9FIRM|nr:SsrA-binding protein SmpB [Anaerosolibacter carboniphilus]MBB6214548.1 SsrA-binding protein [Anaerosolibacter carboniphilus]